MSTGDNHSSLFSYVLLNGVTGVTIPLYEGRNVIGRSPSAVEDVYFINLESPRSAISRLHAVILIASNGDVWISDARSTNGTQIAVRAGPGIVLEPEKWYQGVPGARITFGDVELTLVVDDTRSDASQCGGLNLAKKLSDQAATAAGVPQHMPRTLSDLPPSLIRARSGSSHNRGSSQQGSISQPQGLATSADQLAAALLNQTESVVASGRNSGEDQRITLKSKERLNCDNGSSAESNSALKKSVPYLQPADVDSIAALVDSGSKRGPTKQPRTEPPVPAADNVPPTKKAHRIESAKSDAVRVVLSGFDSKEKEGLNKLVKERRGQVVDEITDAKVDLLVVKDPPTRTPKFLIAMGLGVPVVTSRFLENAAPLADAAQYTPDLLHNGVRYTSKKLSMVTLATKQRKGATHSGGKKRNAFDGKMIFVSDAVGSAKAALVDVIKGCGGTIARKKGDDVTIVTDVDEWYHKLLTGATE